MVNAHPDDLNASLALALIIKQLPCYQLHIIDLTRGERGLIKQGVPMDVCAEMRIKEEHAVCAKLGVKPIFLSEIDGEAFAGKNSCMELLDLFKIAPPRAVFTHWMLDTHPDHVSCSAIAMKAVSMLEERPELYFFRQSVQSRKMPEEFYLPFDSSVMDQKCQLLSLYACQWGDEIAARQRIDNESCGFRVQGKYQYAECFASWQLAGEGTFFAELEQYRKQYNV